MSSSGMPKICNDRSFHAHPLSICFVTVVEIKRLPINSDWASFAGVSSAEVPPPHPHTLTHKYSTIFKSSDSLLKQDDNFCQPCSYFQVVALKPILPLCRLVFELTAAALEVKYLTPTWCWHPMQRWLDPHCVCGLINQAHCSPLAHPLLH